MDDEQELWALEERFWTGGEEFYRDRLAADCVMLFPAPVGRLSGEQILASLAGTPRWSRVTIRNRRVLRPAERFVLLVYEAAGEREDPPSPYRTLAASGYVLHHGKWRLAFHQQTPA